jgi:hypothetical protein
LYGGGGGSAADGSSGPLNLTGGLGGQGVVFGQYRPLGGAFPNMPMLGM